MHVRHLLVLFVSVGIVGSAWAYNVEVLQNNGNPSNRYDLLILGDGYRDVDQTKLTSDVQAFLTIMWTESPYGPYRNFFNVKLIHVVSTQDGADNGMYGSGVLRDTALGAYFNCSNIDRLLCVNTGTVYSVASSHAPDYDSLMVIVNDSKYGGSGGAISVFSTNASSADTAKHEFGHSFGRLADEYEDAYPGYPTCNLDCPEPNVTKKTVRTDIKWNPWIEASTPIPTPENSTYSSVIGLFEGARYFSTGLYRPKIACLMRSLGVAFCSVCQEALVLALYNRVDPIDAITPASPISLTGGQSANLHVDLPHPAPDTMVITWRVDGVVNANHTPDLTLAANTLGECPHIAEVEIADRTGLVKSDPGGLLVGKRSWTINVTGTGSPTCQITGQCVGAGALNPTNPCQGCDPTQHTDRWTDLNGVGCADGLFCNGAESCVAGKCTSGSSPCLDDGLACTNLCDETRKGCNVPQAGSCLIDSACYSNNAINPQNPCQACRPSNRQDGWTHDDSLDCADTLFCNGPEHCLNGACQAGTSPCQDDGLVCTSLCEETIQRCNVLQSGFCLINSVCVVEGAPHPTQACLECRTVLSTSNWSPNDSIRCDDGLFCNGSEHCQSGQCAPGSPPCTEDGLACTELCDETTRRCNRILPGGCLIAGQCIGGGSFQTGSKCELCDPARDQSAWVQDPKCAGELTGGCSCASSAPDAGGLLLVLAIWLVRRFRQVLTDHNR